MCSPMTRFIRRLHSVFLVAALLGGLALAVALMGGLVLAAPSTLGNPGNENGYVYVGGPAGQVYAVTHDSVGDLYVGGSFATAGVVTRVLKFDGSTWSGLGNGFANNRVTALKAVSPTLVYAVGSFTLSGSTPITGVAKWDGSSWSSLCDGTTGKCGVTGGSIGNDLVRAVTTDGVGNVYIGGNFTETGGIASTSGIAKWSPTANSGAGGWSALGSGCSGLVAALAFDSEGNLYVGGSFTDCGGVISTTRIAKWTPGTSTWSALSPIDDGTVNALAFDSKGNLYAVGSFNNIGGVVFSGTAMWNGSTWSAMGSGVNGSGVRGLAVDTADNVYVCGNALTLTGSMGKWNGSSWSPLGTGTSNANYCYALAFRNGYLYTGGSSMTAGWGVTVANANRTGRWTAAEGQVITGPGTYVFYPPTQLVTTTLPVTITVTTQGDLARINIQRFNMNHPNATTGTQTGYYWQIEGLNASGGTASGFSTNLTLPANGFTPDDQDKLCRYTGSEWICGASSFDTTSITRRVVSFSDWAAGNDVGQSVVTLTVTTVGLGTGSVSSEPAAINCGVTCTASFNADTVVTLTATPAITSAFTGWSGACVGGGSCVVTMDAVKSVTATFGALGQLNVYKTGDGSGLVTSAPPGIDCGLTCTAQFNQGAVVTLTATSNGDSKFTGWGGECFGTLSLPTNQCLVTMDAAKDVTATFMLAAYPLTVTKSGDGTGIVSSIPTGISCDPTCTASFDSGAVVTLTATPVGSDSVFTGWSGACIGAAALPTNQCLVTMDAAKSVTATFMANQQLTIGKVGSGNGTIASIPPGIDCGVTCSASFGYATVVTLTATRASDSLFHGWSGACSGTSACVVTMDAAKSVTATFSYDLYTLPFTDDFESGLGKWTVQAGAWSLGADGSHVYSQTNASVTARSFTGSSTWTDYAFRARVKPMGGTYVMLMARYQDASNYYFMTLRTDRNQIEIKKMFGGSSGSALRTSPFSITVGTWYTPTFEVVGSELRGYLNGTLVITATDSTASPFVSGKIGLGTSNAVAEFDDVLVTAKYYVFLPLVFKN